MTNYKIGNGKTITSLPGGKGSFLMQSENEQERNSKIKATPDYQMIEQRKVRNHLCFICINSHDQVIRVDQLLC